MTSADAKAMNKVLRASLATMDATIALLREAFEHADAGAQAIGVEWAKVEERKALQGVGK